MAKSPARSLLLRPADPFDLIRWLARSQSDPRKAVAELVQNSIDAHARHVTATVYELVMRGTSEVLQSRRRREGLAPRQSALL